MRLGPGGTAAGENDALFDVELEVVPEVAVRDARVTDVRLMLNKRNRVIVQRPMVVPVDSVDASALQLPWEAPRFLGATVTVACAPDPDCRFTWLRVEIELGEEGADEARPIACLLLPENGEDELKASGGIEIGGELKLGHPDLASAGITFSRRRDREGSEFRYRVFTFGMLGSTVAWDFRATDVHPEISGDLTLYLIAAMAPAAEAPAAISVSARAEMRRGGPAVPLIMRRSVRDQRGNTFTLRA